MQNERKIKRTSKRRNERSKTNEMKKGSRSHIEEKKGWRKERMNELKKTEKRENANEIKNLKD